MSQLATALCKPLTRPLTSAVTEGGGGGFNAAAFIAAASDGALYDWSTVANTYQESTGATPGVAGQPDGLTLDGKNSYGTSPSLLPTTASGTVGPFASLVQVTVPAAVATYAVTYTIASITSGSIRVADTTNAGMTRSTTGTFTEIYTKASGTGLGLYAAGSGFNGSITGISVCPIPGNHLLQATTASKPTLQAGYVNLDAFDDFLPCASGGGGTTGILVCAAIRAGAAGSARTIWSDRGTNTGYRLSLDTSNNLVLSAGNGTAFTSVTGTAITAGTDYVVQGWHDGTNLNVRAGLGAATSAAFATATAGTAGFTVGRDNGTAAGNYGDRIYRLAYRKNDTSTAAQRDNLARWAAQKAGITL